MKYYKVKLQPNTGYVTTLPQTSGVLYDLKFSNDINEEYYALIQSVWFGNWVCLLPLLSGLNCLQQIIYGTKMSNILKALWPTSILWYESWWVWGQKTIAFDFMQYSKSLIKVEAAVASPCHHVVEIFGTVTPIYF